MRHDASYVLPLRRDRRRDDPELAAYLGWLSQELEVVVVDGSPSDVFADHHRQWGEHVVHLPVVSRCLNGKVAGVIDGVQVATGELVVVADDDVRYDAAGLGRVLDLGASADLVRPQNYFDPLPWHARWDTARSLLNRAAGADFPGTLVVRRAAFLAGDGYCGAVLFENLELIRTLKARGAREVVASDLFVRRLPPPVGHFLRQRVRQAYDSLAQPGRMAVELALLPTLALARRGRRRRSVVAVAAASVVLAEVGRRRQLGAAVFSPDAALWAPLWTAERAVCSWLALVLRWRGGIRYAGRRLACAAHPTRRLGVARCPEECCSCDVGRLGRRDDVMKRSQPVQVSVCPDGPLLVRGAGIVRDGHGVAHRVTRPVVAICRCGKSSMAPWCDGTHKLVHPRGQERALTRDG